MSDTILRLHNISLALDLQEDDVPFILASLRSDDEATRRAAVEVAGEFLGMGFPDLVEPVEALLGDTSASDEARMGAAIAFGPALQLCDEEGFDDEYGDPPLTRATFEQVLSLLHNIYVDPKASKLLRRRALEAAVRAAAADWLEGAVRAAYASNDVEWVQTAIFSSRYVQADFTAEVVEALQSGNPELVHEAVFACTDLEVPRHIYRVLEEIARHPDVNEVVRVGAIVALAAQANDEAHAPLHELMNDDNPVIADAAAEALADPLNRDPDSVDWDALDDEFGDV